MADTDYTLYLGFALAGIILFGILVHYNIIRFGNKKEQKPVFGETWRADYADGSIDEIKTITPHLNLILVKTSRIPKGRYYRPHIDIRPKSLFPVDGLMVYEVTKTLDGVVNESARVVQHAVTSDSVDLDESAKQRKIDDIAHARDKELDEGISKSDFEVLQMDRATSRIKSQWDIATALGKRILKGGKSGKGKLPTSAGGLTVQSGTQADSLDTE